VSKKNAIFLKKAFADFWNKFCGKKFPQIQNKVYFRVKKTFAKDRNSRKKV